MPVSLALIVPVMVAQPVAGVIAPPGGAVEPLVHPPETVQPARIGGISVVDGTVVEREGAHPRPLTRISRHIGPDHRGSRRSAVTRRPRGLRRPRLGAPVIVVDTPLALLLFGDRDLEIEVEVAVER